MRNAKRTKTNENDFAAMDRLARSITPDKLRPTDRRAARTLGGGQTGPAEKTARHEGRADAHYRRTSTPATGQRLCKKSRPQSLAAFLRCSSATN